MPLPRELTGSKPPGEEEEQWPQASSPTPPEDKGDEFCGIPKRRAYCLIALTVLIVLAIGAAVGVVIITQSDDDSEPSNTTVTTTPRPVILVSNPQSRLQLIRDAMSEHPLLERKLALLPTDVGALQSNSENPTMKAAHWLVNQDTELDRDQLAIRFALAAIYHEQEGNTWNDNTNWLSGESNHCDWFGVTCCRGAAGGTPQCRKIENVLNTTIVEVDIPRNNVGGSVSDYFVMFQGLYSLRLPENRLTGSLPAALMKALPRLYLADLQYNQLSGVIPKDLQENGVLNTLFINGNPDLTGDFPPTYCRGSVTTFYELKLDCDQNFCFCCPFNFCIDG